MPGPPIPPLALSTCWKDASSYEAFEIGAREAAGGEFTEAAWRQVCRFLYTKTLLEPKRKAESPLEASAAKKPALGANVGSILPAAKKPSPFLKAGTKAGQGWAPFERVFFEMPAVEGMDLEAVRSELEVSVQGEHGHNIPPLENFSEVPMPDYVTEALAKNEWFSPLPIQAQAIPIIMAGHDVIGIARTGSGKTLAFLIPAIVHIEAQKPVTGLVATPIALVLAPTRELASQIAEEARKLTEGSNTGNHKQGIRAQDVYGGTNRMDQLKKARGCAIVVATPGRLSDFVDSGSLSLSRVTYFVLDEADRMLDMGFIGDVQKFTSNIRPDRHMMFFSATWPAEVQNLAGGLCHNEQDPVLLKVGQHTDAEVTTRSDITQEVIVFDQSTWDQRDNAKQQVLYPYVRETLSSDPTTKILVFVNNKILADELASQLNKEGFMSDAMHGGRPQETRERTLATFKQGYLRLLVATDVMGRGLDIPTITHVVLYDMCEIEDYIHRIGRTARGLCGRRGHALTLYEYLPKRPHLAGGLVKVLEDSECEVPDELRQIAIEVEAGQRPASWTQPSYGAWGGGAKKKKKSGGGQQDDDWGAGGSWGPPPFGWPMMMGPWGW